MDEICVIKRHLVRRSHRQRRNPQVAVHKSHESGAAGGVITRRVVSPVVQGTLSRASENLDCFVDDLHFFSRHLVRGYQQPRHSIHCICVNHRMRVGEMSFGIDVVVMKELGGVSGNDLGEVDHGTVVVRK